MTYLRAFSTIVGISLAKYGLESSKHGLVLTSIIHGFMSSSIIKSYPKISQEYCFLSGSILRDTALIESLTYSFILGTTSFTKSVLLFMLSKYF